MTDVHALSQRDLGDALGLSPSAVTKAKKAGMPTDSIEAARRWRQAHVRPRIGGQPANRAAAQLSRIDALWPVARAALAAGSFDAVEGELRAALRAVPADARPQVQLDVAVMDALCGWFIRACGTRPAAHRGTSDIDSLPGKVWYAVAAGEPFPVDWLEQA